jgi:hypothetical protein
MAQIVTRKSVSVSWRGLVSFLQAVVYLSPTGRETTFQSPGGDWCHFYFATTRDYTVPSPNGFQSPEGD